jgi:hypothetical protein
MLGICLPCLIGTARARLHGARIKTETGHLGSNRSADSSSCNLEELTTSNVHTQPSLHAQNRLRIVAEERFSTFRKVNLVLRWFYDLPFQVTSGRRN